MRKDVKLGLAVGAIFLAVVIVWAAVPHRAKNTGVVLNKPGSNQPVPEQPKAPDAPPAQPQDPSQQQAQTPAPTPDTGGPVAGAGQTQHPATDAHPATDWAAILRAPDDQLPSLIARTPAVVQTGDHHDSDTPEVVIPPSDPHGGMISDDMASHPTTLPGSVSPAAGSSRTHTVAAGETFASIAKSVYGKSSMYLAIEKANPNVNPSRLKVGTVLTLPESTGAASSGTSESDTATSTHGHHARADSTIDSTREYRVQPGDSLHKISVKLYGTGARADEIYTTNKETIGDDPAKLKVGEVLKLPEAPTARAAR